jgi:hypothetical protein
MNQGSRKEGEETPYGVTTSAGDSAKQSQLVADGDACPVMGISGNLA